MTPSLDVGMRRTYTRLDKQKAPASLRLPGRDHGRHSPMAVLDATSEAAPSRMASTASRRDARTWEKIGVGLKRQESTRSRECS